MALTEEDQKEIGSSGFRVISNIYGRLHPLLSGRKMVGKR